MLQTACSCRGACHFEDEIGLKGNLDLINGKFNRTCAPLISSNTEKSRMYLKIFSRRLAVLFVVSAMAACGGGNNDSPCGGSSGSIPVFINFQGLNINNNSVRFEVNKPASLNTVVVPEGCRSSMTFAVKSGALPPGMTLENGNVTGVPTIVGEHDLQLMIVAVRGYAEFNGNNPSTLIAKISIR